MVIQNFGRQKIALVVLVSLFGFASTIAIVQATAGGLVMLSGGSSLVGGELTNAINNARLSVIQLLGGAGLVGGLIYTARTYSITRSSQAAERFLAASQQISDEKLTVRVAGIQNLFALATLSKDYWSIVDEVLSALVRERATEDSYRNAQAVPLDVTIALRILGSSDGRPNRKPGVDGAVNLVGSYLKGASLGGLQLSRAVLDNANLDGADLTDADLSRASLKCVQAVGANFSHATLLCAELMNASSESAEFLGVTLDGADVEQCNFTNTRNVATEGFAKVIGNALHPPALV